MTEKLLLSKTSLEIRHKTHTGSALHAEMCTGPFKQGSKNPVFFKKSPTQWVFGGFFGQAGKNR